VCVAGINPTPLGEGKSTTSVGLTQVMTLLDLFAFFGAAAGDASDVWVRLGSLRPERICFIAKTKNNVARRLCGSSQAWAEAEALVHLAPPPSSPSVCRCCISSLARAGARCAPGQEGDGVPAAAIARPNLWHQGRRCWRRLLPGKRMYLDIVDICTYSRASACPARGSPSLERWVCQGDEAASRTRACKRRVRACKRRVRGL
jgi:hypothetical protein